MRQSCRPISRSTVSTPENGSGGARRRGGFATATASALAQPAQMRRQIGRAVPGRKAADFQPVQQGIDADPAFRRAQIGPAMAEARLQQAQSGQPVLLGEDDDGPVGAGAIPGTVAGLIGGRTIRHGMMPRDDPRRARKRRPPALPLRKR